MNTEIATPVPLIEKESIEEGVSLYQFYKFADNEEKIMSFVEKHYLLGILLEAVREIRRVFGKEISLWLELHHDPEEDFEGLFIIIKTKRSPEESLNLLDRLDEEWWLNVDDNVSNMLEIMVRPI